MYKKLNVKQKLFSNIFLINIHTFKYNYIDLYDNCASLYVDKFNKICIDNYDNNTLLHGCIF